MGLSNDLISQFVKATKDEKETKKESVMYGTAVVGSDGTTQVKLDGSENPTPVSNTSTIEPGDRVTVMIKNHKAVITGNLSSPSVGTSYVDEFDRLLAQKITADELYAETGRIEDLVSERINASDIRVGDLEADNVEIKEQLTANTADINSLKTSKLDAGVANITYAKIGDLDAAIADIGTLDAGVADIRELMFGSASGDTIQTSFSNTVIGQLGDAQIKSAMIESISADKITAGYINTDNIQVRSEAGYLRILGDVLHIRDNKGTSRVQIGKDASGDYSINVWDQNGKLMFSKGGITDAAIKDAIIRNDMVSEEANIDAGKLNIDSLFTEINNSSNTIKSSQVYLDNEKQTLDIAFKSLLSEVLDNSYMVSSQGTSIEVLQGYIATKIWQQDIDTAKNELSTKYSTLEQTVDSISTTVANHSTSVTNTETLIQQLSESISMLVTDGNGTSLMTQTEDGWTFSTANIQSLVNSVSEGLSSLTEDVGDVNDTVDILKQAVYDLGEIAEYVSIGTYEDEPCIELGESDSEFKLRITNTRMMFAEGANILAYFNNQSLHIKKAVVEEELQQGGFVWLVRSNGNLGLVWKGGNS